MIDSPSITPAAVCLPLARLRSGYFAALMSDVWHHRGEAADGAPATQQGGGTGGTVGPPSSAASSSSVAEPPFGGHASGNASGPGPLQLLEFDVDGAGEFDAEAVRQTIR